MILHAAIKWAVTLLTPKYYWMYDTLAYRQGFHAQKCAHALIYRVQVHLFYLR